jgi:hypothetical protein
VKFVGDVECRMSWISDLTRLVRLSNQTLTSSFNAVAISQLLLTFLFRYVCCWKIPNYERTAILLGSPSKYGKSFSAAIFVSSQCSFFHASLSRTFSSSSHTICSIRAWLRIATARDPARSMTLQARGDLSVRCRDSCPRRI